LGALLPALSAPPHPPPPRPPPPPLARRRALRRRWCDTYLLPEEPLPEPLAAAFGAAGAGACITGALVQVRGRLAPPPAPALHCLWRRGRGGGRRPAAAGAGARTQLREGLRRLLHLLPLPPGPWPGHTPLWGVQQLQGPGVPPVVSCPARPLLQVATTCLISYPGETDCTSRWARLPAWLQLCPVTHGLAANEGGVGCACCPCSR
jgi:hypothetical protein